MNSKTGPKALYCGYAWRGLFLNEYGQVFPCCHRVEAPADHPTQMDVHYRPDFLVQNEFMKSVRAELLSGHFPSMCRACELSEELNGHSKRTESLDRGLFSAVQGDVTDEAQASELIDIHLGNICNLECRMCTPRASRRLENIFENIFGNGFWPRPHWQKDPQFWREFKTFLEQNLQVKRLHFAGGEPFLSQELWDFLGSLDDSLTRKKTLSFNSNLTFVPEQFAALAARFKRVKVEVSIDGTNEVHHYIRYPSQLATIIANIEKIRAIPNVEVAVTCVVQIYNVFNLPQFFKMLNRLDLKVTCIWVEGREYLDIVHLPLALKERLQQELVAARDALGARENQIIDDVIRRLWRASGSSEQWREFWRVSESWDKLRGVRLAEIVPPFFYDHRAGETGP